MKIVNKCVSLVKKGVSVVVGTVAATSVAVAAVPAGIDTAVSGAAADAVTIGGYILLGLASMAAIAWMIGAIKKR